MSESENDFSQIAESVRRMILGHRWAIAVTAGVVAVGTVAVLSFIPDRFRSEATLVVVQQQVSQKYVEPTSNTTPFEVVQGLSREVLSRTRLLATIEEFGLYSKLKAGLSTEELAEVMRKDVEIEPIDQIPGRAEFSAFRISFMSDSAQMAYLVAGRLTSMFIEGNTKTRGREAAATTDFLGEQMRLAKQKLLGQEARLNDFKSRYLGELPEQQGPNLGALTELRSQLQGVYTNIARAQQQKLFIEQQRAALVASATSILTRLQTDRTGLLNRFTARHPEVLAKDQEVARTQALIERLKTGVIAVDRSAMPSPEELNASQLRAQMDTYQADMEGYAKDETRVKAEIARYEQRLNLTPVRDQQLKEILRDYDVYSKEYADLTNNQLKSQMTTSLEQRQEGQQFRMIDAPTLPVKAFSPKRLRIAGGGIAAGLFLGLAVAFLLSRKDTSFYSEKLLRQSFPLPLVVGIPLLLTEREMRTRRWKIAAECLAGATVTVLIAAAEYYVYTNQ